MKLGNVNALQKSDDYSSWDINRLMLLINIPALEDVDVVEVEAPSFPFNRFLSAAFLLFLFLPDLDFLGVLADRFEEGIDLILGDRILQIVDDHSSVVGLVLDVGEDDISPEGDLEWPQQVEGLLAFLWSLEADVSPSSLVVDLGEDTLDLPGWVQLLEGGSEFLVELRV